MRWNFTGAKTNCSKCGQQIQKLTNSKGFSLFCNADSINACTENGKKFSGYQVHICKAGK